MRLRARIVAFALLYLCGGAAVHGAQLEEQALERRVKAAYVYRFTEFISWPEPAGAPAGPFVIGIVGSDEIADELRKTTVGRTAAGRPIEIRRVEPGAIGTNVHMLFIPDSERARLAQIIRAAPRGSVIVTESEGALAAGSVINFVLVDGRVRFEISADTAEKRGVRLSSRLITLAQNVRGSTP